MTSLFLSILLLTTIIGAFTLGITLGYWVIRGILHFFDPTRFQRKKAITAAFVPIPSGD